MTSPLLTAYGRTAELARGLKWVDEFESNETVVRNGGVITGAPVINNGATFDGTNDYLTYSSVTDVFNNNVLSFVIEFNPGFSPTANANYLIMDTDAPRTIIYKRDNAGSNYLQININGISVRQITTAIYGGIWQTWGRNVLVISGTSGDTDGWLNGQELFIGDGSVWAPGAPTIMTLGSDFTGGQLYVGSMAKVLIFNQRLTAQEAADYYNRTTWRYRENTKLYFSCRAESYDPVGSLVLDDSGNGYNATLPAGEEPTKLTRRGYSYTPNDHLQTAFSISNDRGEGTLAALVRANATDDAVIMGTTDDDDDHLYLSMRNQLVSGGVGNDDWDVIQGDAADRLDVGVVHSVIMSWTWTEVYLYLDGELVYSAAQSGTPADSNIYVGALYDEASGDDITHWTGDIYEARVFDESLTTTQAWDLHLDMIGRLNDV